jgi:hypothetical protein
VTLEKQKKIAVFDISVTAEDTPHPKAPSDTVVLKGTVERK